MRESRTLTNPVLPGHRVLRCHRSSCGCKVDLLLPRMIPKGILHTAGEPKLVLLLLLLLLLLLQLQWLLQGLSSEKGGHWLCCNIQVVLLSQGCSIDDRHFLFQLASSYSYNCLTAQYCNFKSLRALSCPLPTDVQSMQILFHLETNIMATPKRNNAELPLHKHNLLLFLHKK